MPGDLDRIDKRINSITRVLSGTTDDDPNLFRLARAYHKRFDLLQEPLDIQKVIEYESIILTRTPADDPGRRNLLSDLGRAHNQRFKRLGDMEDIEKSIEYQSIALSLTPDDDPNLPSQLSNLSTCYTDRFKRRGEQADIEKAITYDLRAVQATSNQDSRLPRMLERLGTSYLCRFKIGGEMKDLDCAIDYQSRGLVATPADDSLLPSTLGNLSVSHKIRFKRLGELRDLEKAIQYQSRVLELTPDGHPVLLGRLANLALSLKIRFERLGELADLQQAIQHQSHALALTPDDHPEMASRLANLSISHKSRFKRLGELADLHQAIQYETRALALTPEDHTGMSSRLANLAVSHRNRFRRLGELADLHQAIQYQSRALTLTSDGHPDMSSRLANLAVSLKSRFECLGEMADLQQAIQYQSRALALTPDDHPDMSSRLAHLAISHRSRFKCLGELVDLRQAIQYQSRALALTPDDHPYLCFLHFHYARFHITYHKCNNSPPHLQQSLKSFQLASKSLAGSPRSRFRYAHRWARYASKYSSLNPIEAYQVTINLLPQFIWLGSNTYQRYEDLKTVKTLAANAAFAAIMASSYSLALEWLEHTRCVVWNQNIMLRSPLHQLEDSHPAFALHLKSVAEELHSISSDLTEPHALSSTGSLVNFEQVSDRHRSLAMKYDQLLNQARTFPGFEDFLQPMQAHKLLDLCAAKNGPIVVINCHKNRCDALLIVPERKQIDHISLQNFNAQKAKAACSAMNMSVEIGRPEERGVERRPLTQGEQQCGLRAVLASLWDDVVKPVIDFLGLTQHVSVGNLPHITWCPTGAMSFLPLHASGDYDQPQSRIFDYAISSYAPTLTALLESTPSSFDSDFRMLTISQENTPGHASLPGTATELECVKAHTKSATKYSQLTNDKATTSAVLDAMEQHDWVHLACHAHQNVGDAAKSGFFLQDGVLDLASINRRSLKNKGLAFLSACQTATGDKDLPDEAVHLASGMLMAGYTSVIATLWSVVDSDAPLVADKVYSQLMKDRKLGNGEAGKALHNAVAELREAVGEEQFERWVPYIHIGS